MCTSVKKSWILIKITIVGFIIDFDNFSTRVLRSKKGRQRNYSCFHPSKHVHGHTREVFPFSKVWRRQIIINYFPPLFNGLFDRCASEYQKCSSLTVNPILRIQVTDSRCVKPAETPHSTTEQKKGWCMRLIARK